MALGIANAIVPVPKKAWVGKPWNNPVANPEILNPTVVLGPYRIQEFKSGDHAILTAVDTYYVGKPRIETIELIPSLPPSVAFDLLRTGRVNWLSNLPPLLFKQARADPTLNTFNWAAANAGYRVLQFNLARPFLSDRSVREALTRSLNRADLIAIAEEGFAEPQFSFIGPNNTRWVNPNVEQYPFDPNRARQLLELAGYRHQAGKLVDQSGLPVRIQVPFPPTSQPRARVASYLQQQYRDLGIDVELKGLGFGEYNDTVNKRQDFDIALGSYAGGDLDPDLCCKPQLTSLGQQNRQSYANPRIDDLFKQAQDELDPVKRKLLYDEAQKIVAEDLPSFYLYTYQTLVAISKKVEGVKPTRGERLFYNDAILSWFIVP